MGAPNNLKYTPAQENETAVRQEAPTHAVMNGGLYVPVYARDRKQVGLDLVLRPKP